MPGRIETGNGRTISSEKYIPTTNFRNVVIDAMASVTLRGNATTKADGIREAINALGLDCEGRYVVDIGLPNCAESALDALVSDLCHQNPGDVSYSIKSFNRDGVLLIHDPDEAEELIRRLYHSHSEHDFETAITLFALEIAYVTSRRDNDAATLHSIRHMLEVMECHNGADGEPSEEAKIAGRMLAAAE